MSVDAPTAPMATTEAGDPGAEQIPRELQRGMQFGRFLVTAPLGAGGAGSVYAAYDPELDRRVALKVLHLSDDGDDDPVLSEWPRLVREARALARLSHPNVVVVHDIGIERGRAWLATELVDGSDLWQWLAVRPGLPPEEIVGLFIGAGRGLAAAHAAGLVHGDFKPANVLVGSDGRARVADFGLARVQARTAVPTRAAEAGEKIVIVGTPYYMAPEQTTGADADARADQYAFCLSWLEAHLRRRIWGTSSVSQLFIAKQADLDETLLAELPGWLARILGRGLARDPADRHASMDALLAAVGAAHRRRDRRRIGLGIVGALGLGATVSYVAFASTETAACEGSARHVDAVWNDARRGEGAGAFTAAQAVLGAPAWSRAEAAIDAFAQQWIAGHRSACLAVHHGEQRVEITDARDRCLDDALDRLVALVDLFADADLDTVLRADAATGALPDIAACEDPQTALRRFGPTTEDAAVMAELQQRLRRIDAAMFVARLDRAQALLDETTPFVEGSESRRAAHALDVRRGKLLRERGDFAEAESTLQAAILGAVAVGDDATALLGIAPMIRCIGAAQMRYDDAIAWARWYDPLATRTDAPAAVRADILAAAARIDLDRHDADESLRKLESAKALLGEVAPPAELAILEVDIGGVLRTMGDLEPAERRVAAARDTIGRVLGTGHPEYAAASGELGVIRLQRGDKDGARALFEEAVAVTRAAYGPEHAANAPALNNLAAFEGELGNYEASRRLLLESLEVERKQYGHDHLVTAPTLLNLATAALWLNEPARALGEIAAAERIFRAADPDRSELAGVYRQKSFALGELGRPAEAVAAALLAVELIDRHRDPDDPARADVRMQLGSARTMAGDRDGAKVAYDEAVAILERGAAKTPGGAALLANTLELRAEVLAQAGDEAAAAADRTRAASLVPDASP